MLILCDRRIPAAARRRLEQYGELLNFYTKGITYDAISCHPDIFFCPTPSGLIVAPNLPRRYQEILQFKGIVWQSGKQPVGGQYPQTAHYNCLFTEKHLVHNLACTDDAIMKNVKGHALIHCAQGYTRCNLVHLTENSFVTSDRGIETVLKKSGADILYADPSAILLPGAKHGFFGGACGRYRNKLFLCGGIKHLPQQELLLGKLENLGIEIIELYPGPLFDGGGILFMD